MPFPSGGIPSQVIEHTVKEFNGTILKRFGVFYRIEFSKAEDIYNLGKRMELLENVYAHNLMIQTIQH
jgi:hypothetical protein